MTTVDRTTWTRYQVYKANIMNDDGDKVLAGEIVALSPKLARHYGKFGYLKPVFDDDEGGDEEPEEMDDDGPAIPTRTRRVTPVTENTRLQTGTATKPL